MVSSFISHAWLDFANKCTEIAQQAKIRKKDGFLEAFEPIIVEGTSAAYKGSGPDIQNKIRRVIEVWRQRNVFRLPVQEEIERSLNGTSTTVLSLQSSMLTSYRNRPIKVNAKACSGRFAFLQLHRSTRT